jgi:hypothetical protein
MSGNVLELQRAPSSEFDRITQAALQELSRIAAKEAEFSHWRTKVATIDKYCQEILDHTHKTCQTAIDSINRIFHPNTFLKNSNEFAAGGTCRKGGRALSSDARRRLPLPFGLKAGRPALLRT